MVNVDVERVRAAMADLCEPLHDAFAWAEQKRRRRLRELTDPSYRWLGTHLIRGFAHHRLAKADLGAWSLTGKHSRNGELWLGDGDYRVRVLHTPDDEAVPAPGSNLQRRAFYLNPPLALYPEEPLFGPVNDQLLALWRIDPQTGAPFFRVVRPIGLWKFGSAAKTDLDFLLPETAAELHELYFQPHDEGLELELPKEEPGYGHGARGFSG